VTGRRVRELDVTGPDLVWDGRDGHGRSLPAGVYWIAIPAGATSPAGVVRVVKRP